MTSSVWMPQFESRIRIDISHFSQINFERATGTTWKRQRQLQHRRTGRNKSRMQHVTNAEAEEGQHHGTVV